MIVKLVEDGWIEVYRQGELSSEWCVDDGEVFEWLARLLYNQPPVPEEHAASPIRT